MSHSEKDIVIVHGNTITQSRGHIKIQVISYARILDTSTTSDTLQYNTYTQATLYNMHT